MALYEYRVQITGTVQGTTLHLCQFTLISSNPMVTQSNLKSIMTSKGITSKETAIMATGQYGNSSILAGIYVNGDSNFVILVHGVNTGGISSYTITSSSSVTVNINKSSLITLN